MKKSCKRGFVLAETIGISVTIITVLILIFIQFSTVDSSYYRTLNYDNVNDLYLVDEFKQFVEKSELAVYSRINDENLYVDLTDCDGITEYMYCEFLIKAMDIKQVIVTKRDTTDLISELDNTKFSENMKNYIRNSRSNNNGYRIIVEFNNGSISGLTTDGTGSAVFGGVYVAAEEGDTHKGIVYLNPRSISLPCTEEMANQNVNEYGALTGVNTGCMRFYIFDDSGDKYKMILDHNTSGDVAWNSTNSNSEMKEVKDRLQEDTNGWIGSPRLITAEEVHAITEGPSSWNVSNANTWYYFGSKNQTGYSSQAESQKAIQQSYAWLFDNLYQSSNYGGSISDDNQYPNANNLNVYIEGYWTSSAVSGSASNVWHVFRFGRLNNYGASNANYFGVRPVIEITKTLIR